MLRAKRYIYLLGMWVWATLTAVHGPLTLAAKAQDAQPPESAPAILPGTVQHTLSSKLLGEDITIAVSVPFGYMQVDARYPLLIALDGNVMVGMATEIPRLMAFEGTAPPMVVASILYADMQSWFRGRMRDFHPKDNGAAIFLKALQQEIVPFIEARYRTQPDDRALYGHSSGGLFATFAAVEAPDLFARILATSPSLEEEPDWAADMLLKLDDNATIPKIYMSVDASEAAMIAAIEPFAAHLRAREAAFRYDTLDQGGHMAVIPAAYAQGLRWFYTGQ